MMTGWSSRQHSRRFSPSSTGSTHRGVDRKVRPAVCLSVCVLHKNVMSVCSAFKESSRWREGRGGRAKLFDRLGCCFTTPNVSTPHLQHAGHMCVTGQVTCVSHDRYSKFIRGKDLSSKSAHDLSCVLGKKRKRRKGDSVSEEGGEGHREEKVSASHHEVDPSETDRLTGGSVLVASS